MLSSKLVKKIFCWLETIYLSSVPNMKKALINGMKTPVSECISEDKVNW